MKKLFLVLHLITIISIVNAQKVTYTSSDLATVGESFPILKTQYNSANMLSLSEIDPNGWNFSSLVAETQDEISILSKDDFPELAALPEGTMVMEQDDQSYICMYLNGDILEMLGLLVDLNGTLTPMIFPEPQNMLHLPLTIGEGGSSDITFPIQGTPQEFGFDIPFHDSVRFDISVIATSTVEDTGTVQTFQYAKPAFKVVNSTIFNVDIWALPSIGSWYLLQENVVSDSTKLLQYYNPEYGIPMVEVGLSWTDSVLSYKMVDDNTQSIVNKLTDINIYPNPVKPNNKLHFNQNLTNIALYDITGRLILVKKGTYKNILIPNISDGYYILKSENPLITKRIIIDN
jgi:hypothetical protein